MVILCTPNLKVWRVNIPAPAPTPLAFMARVSARSDINEYRKRHTDLQSGKVVLRRIYDRSQFT